MRVSTTTAFTGVGGRRSPSTARRCAAPYPVLAIGDPKTLDTALNIPGGVAAAIRNAGGDAHRQRADVGDDHGDPAAADAEVRIPVGSLTARR